MTRNIPLQKPSEVVYTENWASGQLSYEEGAREKSTVYSPEKLDFDFIKSDHMYLSKKSNKRYPVQFWMEIIAYRFGLICGVQVPPAHVSVDKDNICRALSEWFYVEKRADEHEEFYVHGYLLLKKFDEKLDKKRGRRHCLPLLLDFINNWSEDNAVSVYMTYSFFKIFVFDALIANTDRHHENWGMVFKKDKDEYSLRIAPAFDNGTSLGHNYVEDKLDILMNDQEWLDKYVVGGYHHLRKAPEGEHFQHVELIRYFITEIPKLREVLKDILSFDMEDVKKMLLDLIRFEVPVKFTENRAKFTYAIIEAKKNALQKVLDDVCTE